MYQNLNSLFNESTNARASASTPLSYITSSNTESLKGTKEAFILHWQDQIQVCETLVPTDSHFSEHQITIMLENSVTSVVPLRAMKDQSDK